MPIIRHLKDFPHEARGGAVAIGNFDGVHRGHQRLVERLLNRAATLPGPALVFTFDPHPVRLLRPEQCPPPLTWTRRKAELLSALDVDLLVAYPTDRRILQLTAQEFFDEIVVGKLGARAVVEGPNFHFGRGREGDVRLLGRLASSADITLDVVEPVVVDGDLVSSSRIRESIGAGEVAAARNMLTAPYRIRGMVTHGAGRGATIGFPTANLEAVDTLLPKLGVYAGRALTGGEWRRAAIHLGPNPTFGERRPKVEVHLIDSDLALYGQPLEVEFIERLRDVATFDSPERLVAQLESDVLRVRSLMKAY
ncbi:MAG: bifunctional riboflavin kinase/FAD synthetase, partial [Planctomycetota bacterium]